MRDRERNAYLAESRRLAVEHIASLAGEDDGHALYHSMLSYPLREAKGLRPALCIATARALGGKLEEAIPSAAVVELYHNAFLIHDDVEDRSRTRRGEPTLHRAVGEAAAINVGDAMLALALDPLLDNMRLLDLSRALRILRLVSRMARETAEGQALELAWIRGGRWDLAEDDYVRMVRKKTAWYTFVTPLRMGGIIAERDDDLGPRLTALGEALGVAFQIQDDLLNLEAPEAHTGKETCGDLHEAKRTLMVTHYVRTAAPADAAWALDVLSRPRPRAEVQRDALGATIAALRDDGEVTPHAAAALLDQLGAESTEDARQHEDVAELRRRLEDAGSLTAAREVADRYAARARSLWLEVEPAFAAGTHRDLVSSVVDYVTTRDR